MRSRWGGERPYTFQELIAAGPPGCMSEREWALFCATVADGEIESLWGELASAESRGA